MIDAPIVKVSIEGPLQLGSHSSGLVSLESAIRVQKAQARAGVALVVELTSSWFDITMLSFLSQQLRKAKSIFSEVRLRTPALTRSQANFLWRVGFWRLVAPNSKGSNLTCEPDPWPLMPADLHQHSNFTSYLHSELGEGFSAQPIVESWEVQLESMWVYEFIRESDLIQSREYLFLLLWELLQNSQDHSEGHTTNLAGQILLEPHRRERSDVALERILQQLHAQHENEIANSVSQTRRRWLADHRAESFLIISSTDDGIGIPESLRRHGKTFPSDSAAIQTAFHPSTSTRMGDPSLFDVHGLSQVLRLVRDCDGYLFVQSGGGQCEYTSGSGVASSIDLVENVAPGTLFQIILPFSANHRTSSASKYIPSSAVRSAVTAHERPNRRTLVVFEALQRLGVSKILSASEWPGLATACFEIAGVDVSDTLYLDLVCLPPNRQFISYLLRVLRKRLVYGTVIVVNASPELAALLSGLEKLDEGTPLSDEEVGALLDADRDISTALPRGQRGWCLPLLVPFSSVRKDGSSIEVRWMGISGIRESLQKLVRHALTYLFQQESAASWTDLWSEVRSKTVSGAEDKDSFQNAFKALCRCNRALLQFDGEGCEMNLSPFDLYLVSYFSLSDEFIKNILPKGEHMAGDPGGRVYSLGWRPPPHRFRKRFYRTWEFLSDPKLLDICADLLVRTAFAKLGEGLLKTTAIVSVTPSAGLLGRRIAELLKAEFWEAPSIYDVQSERWLPVGADDNVLIVDDVFDTGTLTSTIARLIETSGARCVGTLALIRSEEGRRDDTVKVDVVEASVIALGDVTQIEVDAAVVNETLYDIDPHSLEPIAFRAFVKTTDKEEERRSRHVLSLLASSRVVAAGHFVQAGHHYNMYFSMPALLANTDLEQRLFEWLRMQIGQFVKTNESVTVVYPYYSPIHLVIRAIRSGRYGIGVPDERIIFVVAKPVQRSGDRLGYSLDPSNWRGTSKVVFIDDGLGTGGTLASIIDELIDQNVRSILALILFDRIGFHPRRHLRRLSAYKTGRRQIAFAFKTFFSTNLRTYFAGDCIECRIGQLIAPLAKGNGLVAHSFSALRDLIVPLPIPFARPLPSRLTTTEVTDVLNFRNAVFSDKPSGREIAQSLNRPNKSGRAKAEMLSTVLLDRKLNRQVVDRDACIEVISTLLVAQECDDGARARFILHMPLWQDQELALFVVTALLPDAFMLRARKEQLGSQTLDRYFNRHLLDFCATGVALRSIVEGLATRPSVDHLLDKWRAVFRGDTSPYGSVYLFELTLLLSEQSKPALEQARFLIANFAGTFSLFHEEALSRRIRLFLTNVGSRKDLNAKRLLPLPVLRSLLDAIASVQSHFLVDHFQEKSFADISKAYQRWTNGYGSEDLVGLLHRHFKSRSPHVRKATIGLLLKEITPKVNAVVDRAVEEFCVRVKEKAACLGRYDLGALADVNLLGRDDFLVRTIAHLLRNPVEHRCGYRYEGDLAGLSVSLQVSLSTEDEGIVEFRITNNIPDLSQADINAAFRKSGGLDSQQLRIKEWGGDLEGQIIPEIGSVFVLSVQRSYPVAERDEI